MSPPSYLCVCFDVAPGFKAHGLIDLRASRFTRGGQSICVTFAQSAKRAGRENKLKVFSGFL